MLNVSTLPPKVRQVIYYVFAIAGVAFGAIEIAIGDPHWLTVAMTVLSFVGASVGVTAGIHTGTTKIPDAPDGSVTDANTTGVDESQTPTLKRAEVPSSPSSDVPASTALPSPELPEPDGGDGAAEVISAGDSADEMTPQELAAI